MSGTRIQDCIPSMPVWRGVGGWVGRGRGQRRCVYFQIILSKFFRILGEVFTLGESLQEEEQVLTTLSLWGIQRRNRRGKQKSIRRYRRGKQKAARGGSHALPGEVSWKPKETSSRTTTAVFKVHTAAPSADQAF